MSAVDEYRRVVEFYNDGRVPITRVVVRADAAIMELDARIAQLDYRIDRMVEDHDSTRDELAALKARRCETCKDSSQTEHGDFCCEIGLEMVDYEPFPDGFSCSEWETRP